MSDDILVFDNLNNKNQEIINKVSNKKIIDLGQYFEFEKQFKLEEKNTLYGYILIYYHLFL